MKDLWQQSYDISSLLTNARGKLGFYSLLQILQDTAVQHAHNLSLGREAMAGQNLFWVLTRQKIEVSHWPKYGEKIHTSTWLRVQPDGFVVRDFKIEGSDGKTWGLATSSWLTLDAQTRRPVKIDAHKLLAGIAREESTGLLAPKISAKVDYLPLASFQVRNSDIDANNHVNNTRYGQWILDAVPFQRHDQYVVKGYEVNFLAETRLGDTIQIEQGPAGEWTDFRGVRETDKKVVFTARLQVVDAP